MTNLSLKQTAEEHAAEVAKLQATKAAAEAKQAQLEKDQKAALERMRTQITFNVSPSTILIFYFKYTLIV